MSRPVCAGRTLWCTWKKDKRHSWPLGLVLTAAALSVILSTYYAPGTAKSRRRLFSRLGIRGAGRRGPCSGSAVSPLRLPTPLPAHGRLRCGLREPRSEGCPGCSWSRDILMSLEPPSQAWPLEAMSGFHSGLTPSRSLSFVKLCTWASALAAAEAPWLPEVVNFRVCSQPSRG